MVTREMLERWAYSVGVTGQPLSRDLETEARAIIALCLAALDAREAIETLEGIDLEGLLGDVGRLELTPLNRPALELVILSAQDVVRAARRGGAQ